MHFKFQLRVEVDAGNRLQVHSDFVRMLKIVKAAGYTGYINIEYEGNDLSEAEGIRATKALLEKAGRLA